MQSWKDKGYKDVQDKGSIIVKYVEWYIIWWCAVDLLLGFFFATQLNLALFSKKVSSTWENTGQIKFPLKGKSPIGWSSKWIGCKPLIVNY